MATHSFSDPLTSRAVLIGVHDYEHLDSLPSVEQNLSRLTALLADSRTWGLPAGHCVTLSQPTRDEVFDALYDATEAATDTLLIYFAGHGLAEPNSGELYLALAGTTADRFDRAIRYDEVRSAVLGRGGGRGTVRARRKVVVLDCCYSGRAHAMSAGPRLDDETDIEGTYVLTASSRTGKALAPPGETYTAFTGELIALMEDGLPHGEPDIDLRTVYGELGRRLKAKGRPRPEQRNSATAGGIRIIANRYAGSVSSGPYVPPSPAQETGHHPALTNWWAGLLDTLPTGRGRGSKLADRARAKGSYFGTLLNPGQWSAAEMKAAYSKRGLALAALVVRDSYKNGVAAEDAVKNFAEYAHLMPETAGGYLRNSLPFAVQRRNRILVLRRLAVIEPELTASLLRKAYPRSPRPVHDLCEAADVPVPPIDYTNALHHRLSAGPNELPSAHA